MYPKQEWKDHAVERPLTYTEIQNEDGSKTFTPAPGEVYQTGTPMNAAKFNNAETGIADTHIFTSVFVQFFLNFKRWVESLFTVVVRADIEQALETAEQAQARANIDAQNKITTSGMLKGDGNGGITPGTAGTDYAAPVTEITGTLSSGAWSGTEAPFTQAVTVSGMTATKKGVSVGLADSATSEQYLAAAAAMLHATAQGTNSVTLTAEGTVPEIDLPILIRVVG